MKSVFGLHRFRFWISLIFVLLVSAVAIAQVPDQNQPPDNSNNPANNAQYSTYNSASSQNAAPPELSADDIINILEQNPDLVSSMKMQAQQSGITGTKEQFIQRLQTDEQFRIQVTQYLIDQGVVDPKDPRLRANGTQAGQNGANAGPGQKIYPNNQQGPNQQQMGQY